MRNNKKLIYEQYYKIKNDINITDDAKSNKINKLIEKLLDITGYEVQDNGTIFDTKRDISKENKNGYYGNIMDQVQAVENILKLKETNIIKKFNIAKLDKNTIKQIASVINKKMGGKTFVLHPKYNIEITMSGIKETVNKNRLYIARPERIKHFLYVYDSVENILKNAIKTDNNVKSFSQQEADIVYDYYLSVVEIEGNNFAVVSIIKKDTARNMLYLNNVDMFEIKKEGMLSGVSSDILESLPDMSQPSNNSINDKIEIVKKRINGIKDKG